jgi:hypothetical protein
MALAKNWIFNLYFNYKDEEGRKWAETRRDEGLVYMKKTMERKSRFSVIAKDESKSCLLLRGYMHLNSACKRDHVKKLLGKYSNCKMASSGDVVNLLKYFNIDKNVVVTGELPSQNQRKKDDARWVMRVVRDSTGDFERVETELVSDKVCSK